METVKMRHNSGVETTYKVYPSGTAYHEETSSEVCQILEQYRGNQKRLKIYYGDHATGRDWNEEHGTAGYIGRSTGKIKVPLLLYNSKSKGGGSIPDHSIVKIKYGTRVLYQTKNYQTPKIEITPSELPEYKFNLYINGALYSRHKTEHSAKILKNKLS